jgi:hypothetical protein
LLSGRGQERTTVASEGGGSEEVCVDRFPNEIGDFFR